MDAITTHQASQNLDGLISKVIADIEPTIVCSDNGQKAVLMSLDEFNSWQETLYLLSNPANAEHLRLSIAEAQSAKYLEERAKHGNKEKFLRALSKVPDIEPEEFDKI